MSGLRPALIRDPMPWEWNELEARMARPEYSRVGDYFGLWAMHEPQFAGLFDLVMRMDLAEHVKASQADPVAKSDDQGLAVSRDGIAVISLSGTLMKQASSFSSSTSTVDARRKVRDAKSRADVLGALFVIDSPGGTVAGNQALAEDIAALQAEKPTAAFIEDLGASAAYWLASQTGHIATNGTGLVGSIGTFMAVRDTSKAAEDMNIKVHVIRAGALKGAGTPGTEITDEMLAAWQQMVNQLNDQFVGAVAKGRKMTVEQVLAIADGRVFVGQEALKNGLVDAVWSVEDSVRLLTERIGSGRKSGSSSSKGGRQMAATYQELKANLVGADPAFITSQLDAGAELPAAMSAWMQEQNKRIQSANQAAADAAEAAKLKPGAGPGIGAGTEENPEAGAESGDVIADWNALMEDCLAKTGGDQDAALLRAAGKNPALHAKFKAATNPEFSGQILKHAKKLGVDV